MSSHRVGRGRAVLGIVGLCVTALIGCAARASDTDIQEVCATRAACGSTDISCLPNLRAQRDNADEVGCSGDFAAAVSCENANGTCMGRSACRDAYAQSEACLANPPDGADAAAFCEAYRTEFCRREREGGRMSELDYNGCVHRTSPEGPYDYCTGFRFTCAPSRDRADQCISALGSTPVSVRTELVSECDWCT